MVLSYRSSEGIEMWFWLALALAVFAALTAILAKVGIEGVGSNLATAIRTMVVVLMAVLLHGFADGRRIKSCPNR